MLGPMDMVYFAVLLIVCVSIYATVSTSLTDGLIGPRTTMNTTAQYAAASNVSSGVFSGFQTLATTPTLIGAVVILGIVGVLMYRQ